MFIYDILDLENDVLSQANLFKSVQSSKGILDGDNRT